MKNDITRRDALALGVSAAALAATGASAQTPASSIKAADVPAPTLPIEKGASLRMLRPVRFVQADEDVFRANAAKFTQKTGVEVKVDFVGWEDINQQTAVTSNCGAGPDIIIGFSDAPHIYVDKLIELTDVADYLGKRYGGWLILAAEIRQARQEQRLDRIAVRRQRRSAGLSQIDPAIGRLRQGAGRSRRDPRPLPEAAEGRQARGLRARQRGRRRQRLCELAVVVAQRLAARRRRQRHHQQQGDGRRAEISQGTVSDLHCRHAVLERRQQQPRLLVAGNFPDRQRRLAVFLAEERSGDQGDRRRYRASVAAARASPASRRWRA